MGKIRITTTKRYVKKSSAPAKVVKDKNGKAHCSRCGAYINGKV